MNAIEREDILRLPAHLANKELWEYIRKLEAALGAVIAIARVALNATDDEEAWNRLNDSIEGVGQC